MVQALRCGQMVLSTRASGATIKQTAMANSGMLTEMFTKVTGWTIKQMGTGFMSM